MRSPGGEHGDSVRAFVALDLEEHTREELVALLGELRHRLPRLRCVSPAGLHLTLRFLGDSPRPSLARLEDALGAAAQACPPTTARLSGLGMFPGRGAPRVLWLGIELQPAVLELQAACERAAVAAGFPPERRPFRPHLTLGRWRDRVPRPDLPPVDVGTTTFPALALLRSELRPEGAVYTPLARFPLGRPGPEGVAAPGRPPCST